MKSAVAVFLLMLGTTLVYALEDAALWNWRSAHELPIHWDNIEASSRAWIGGVQPRYDRDSGVHVVELVPHGYSIVAVPAGQWLQFVALDAELDAGDLKVTRSVDGRLFVPEPVQTSRDPRKLVTSGLHPGMGWVRVETDSRRRQSLRLAMFVSRLPATGQVAVYPHELDMEKGADAVRLSERPGRQTYWHLQPNQDAELEVQGPQRITLRSRLVLGEHTRSREQTYRIEVRLDSGEYQALELETSDERRDAVRIGACSVPAGRYRQAHIRIPPGAHRLSLRSSRALYVQLTGSDGANDYLFSSNAATLPPGNPADAAGASIWSASPDSLQQLFAPSTGVPASQRLAQRLARDNRWQAANLLAAQGLAGPPAYSHEALSRFRLAQRRALTMQHYTDLVPNEVKGEFRQRTMKFSSMRLVEKPGAGLMWKRQVPALAGRIASGEFVQTPLDRRRALHYSLPERGFDTHLRLVVHAEPVSDQATLQIQFDEGPVQTVRLENRLQTARPAVLQPDRATLAAAITSGSGPEWRSVGIRQLPWGEIKLPARVKNLRLWSGSTGMWTAVQVRQSAAYLPNEGNYIAAIDAIGRNKALERFLERLGTGVEDPFEPAPAREPVAVAELDNLWLPLMRYLHVQARYFSTDTEIDPVDDTGSVPDTAAADFYRRRAEKAEQEGDLVLAIEFWSHALNQLQGEDRQDIQLRRALALHAAGETVLARRELWRLYRDAGNFAIQGNAMDELLAMARLGDDTERGLRILSAALLLRPGQDLMERLVPELIANGRFNEALQIALLLPDSPRVRLALLEAARSESWWSAFERAWMRMPDGEEKRFWAAWPYVAAGDYPRALALWAEAGKAGEAAGARLQAALDIRRAFTETVDTERHQALLGWEQWQAEFLDKPVWRPAREAIRSHAGSATVVIPQLGLRLRRYLAGPSRELGLEVYGPARLRVSLRPLHERSQVLPVDDWLVVSMDGRRQYHPVNGNAPDPERTVAEHSDLQPGQRERFFIDVPAGYHRLQLALRDHDALFAVDLARAPAFGAVLPVLTPERAVQLASGLRHASDAGIEWPVQLAEGCDTDRVNVVLPAPPVGGEPDAAILANLSALRQPDEQSIDQDPVRELAASLWQSEQDPDRLAELAAVARTMYSASPADPELQALMRRIRRGMSWEPVTNLWQRAGVHDIPVQGSGAEHPSARIRHALLPPLEEQEERISGLSALVFTLEQPYPVKFRFDFTLEGLLEKPVADIRVAIGIDNRRERIVNLDPGNISASFRTTIDPGSHSVRIRLLDPVARHSVRVRVSERQAGKRWVLRTPRPAQRSYNVATAGEPLILHARGPGLMRIDEWRDDHISYRLRSLESGWQKLTFTVPPGREEALYRVFQWVADTPDPALPPALPQSRLTGLPAAPVVNTYDLPAAPETGNQLELGGQEDGTLSGTLELANRRNLDEDRDTGAGAERFVELRATHRRYLAHLDGYHRFDALTRIREDGGPTLGLREFLSIKSDWHDVELDLNASLYLQRPGGEAGTEWLGDLRARLLQRRDISTRSYHRPSLRLFRRWMSLNDDLDEDPERVDQDVFTTYKEQHRHGLGLGDDLFYRPWGDMVSWLGVSVTSNEDFNIVDPDNVRGRIGARVLWRDWDFGAEYTATHFFDDDDRNSSRTRQRLRLETQMWRWNTPRHGLQMRLRFDHDRSSGDNSVWLSLNWHRANGRLFRDFRPGDINFRALRERITNERLYTKDSGVQR